MTGYILEEDFINYAEKLDEKKGDDSVKAYLFPTSKYVMVKRDPWYNVKLGDYFGRYLTTVKNQHKENIKVYLLHPLSSPTSFTHSGSSGREYIAIGYIPQCKYVNKYLEELIGHEASHSDYPYQSLYAYRDAYKTIAIRDENRNLGIGQRSRNPHYQFLDPVEGKMDSVGHKRYKGILDDFSDEVRKIIDIHIKKQQEYIENAPEELKRSVQKLEKYKNVIYFETLGRLFANIYYGIRKEPTKEKDFKSEMKFRNKWLNHMATKAPKSIYDKAIELDAKLMDKKFNDNALLLQKSRNKNNIPEFKREKYEKFRKINFSEK